MRVKCLLLSVAAAQPVLPETDWFSEAGHGVFTHYLSGLQNNFGRNSQGKNSTWEECVHEFDAEAYAKDAAATGAKYAVLTVMQGSQFMIAPNAAYDRYGGYTPGEACSTRDLVLDVHAALARQTPPLHMMLYWTCDGPGSDQHAHEAVGWPEDHDAACPFTACSAGSCSCTVPDTFLQRWAGEVLHEYAVRYGNKVSGWWIDGCFRRPYGYNESSLKPFRDAVRAGNPKAILGMNNGVHHPIGTFPESDDWTTRPGRATTGPKCPPRAS